MNTIVSSFSSGALLLGGTNSFLNPIPQRQESHSISIDIKKPARIVARMVYAIGVAFLLAPLGVCYHLLAAGHYRFKAYRAAIWEKEQHHLFARHLTAAFSELFTPVSFVFSPVLWMGSHQRPILLRSLSPWHFIFNPNQACINAQSNDKFSNTRLSYQTLIEAAFSIREAREEAVLPELDQEEVLKLALCLSDPQIAEKEQAVKHRDWIYEQQFNYNKKFIQAFKEAIANLKEKEQTKREGYKAQLAGFYQKQEWLVRDYPEKGTAAEQFWKGQLFAIKAILWPQTEKKSNSTM